ncbi:hypothetical protein BHE74_00058330, partial [Ensete ventricosum]
GIEDVRRSDHLRLHSDSQVAVGHRRRPPVAESEEGWVEEEEGQPSLRRGGDGGRLRGLLPGVRRRVRRVGGKRRGGSPRRSALCFPSQRLLCSREKFNHYGAFVPEALILPIAYHAAALHHAVRGPCGEARVVLLATGACRPCPPYLCQVGRTTTDPSVLVSGRLQHIGSATSAGLLSKGAGTWQPGQYSPYQYLFILSGALI